MEQQFEVQKKAALVLECGIGDIEADQSQLERLDEFCERLELGEFHRRIAYNIVCDCVDGRCEATAGPLRPNSAGGSETIMVADDLTRKRRAKDTDGSTLAQYKATLQMLSKGIKPIGGHTAEGAKAPGSGCGANDKLPQIYDFIANRGGDVLALARAAGADIDPGVHEMIVRNAAERSEFNEGAELLDTLRAQPGARTSELIGKHREVVAVWNLKNGTTLDREALKREFPDHQAFNVDAWAFEESARLLTDDESEIEELVTAMAYYNLATACVLGGKSLRVVVAS